MLKQKGLFHSDDEPSIEGSQPPPPISNTVAGPSKTTSSRVKFALPLQHREYEEDVAAKSNPTIFARSDESALRSKSPPPIGNRYGDSAGVCVVASSDGNLQVDPDSVSKKRIGKASVKPQKRAKTTFNAMSTQAQQDVIATIELNHIEASTLKKCTLGFVRMYLPGTKIGHLINDRKLETPHVKKIQIDIADNGIGDVQDPVVVALDPKDYPGQTFADSAEATDVPEFKDQTNEIPVINGHHRLAAAALHRQILNGYLTAALEKPNRQEGTVADLKKRIDAASYWIARVVDKVQVDSGEDSVKLRLILARNRTRQSKDDDAPTQVRMWHRERQRALQHGLPVDSARVVLREKPHRVWLSCQLSFYPYWEQLAPFPALFKFIKVGYADKERNRPSSGLYTGVARLAVEVAEHFLTCNGTLYGFLLSPASVKAGQAAYVEEVQPFFRLWDVDENTNGFLKAYKAYLETFSQAITKDLEKGAKDGLISEEIRDRLKGQVPSACRAISKWPFIPFICDEFLQDLHRMCEARSPACLLLALLVEPWWSQRRPLTPGGNQAHEKKALPDASSTVIHHLTTAKLGMQPTLRAYDDVSREFETARRFTIESLLNPSLVALSAALELDGKGEDAQLGIINDDLTEQLSKCRDFIRMVIQHPGPISGDSFLAHPLLSKMSDQLGASLNMFTIHLRTSTISHTWPTRGPIIDKYIEQLADCHMRRQQGPETFLKVGTRHPCFPELWEQFRPHFEGRYTAVNVPLPGDGNGLRLDLDEAQRDSLAWWNWLASGSTKNKPRREPSTSRDASSEPIRRASDKRKEREPSLDGSVIDDDEAIQTKRVRISAPTEDTDGDLPGPEDGPSRGVLVASTPSDIRGSAERVPLERQRYFAPWPSQVDCGRSQGEEEASKKLDADAAANPTLIVVQRLAPHLLTAIANLLQVHWECSVEFNLSSWMVLSQEPTTVISLVRNLGASTMRTIIGFSLRLLAKSTIFELPWAQAMMTLSLLDCPVFDWMAFLADGGFWFHYSVVLPGPLSAAILKHVVQDHQSTRIILLTPPLILQLSIVICRVVAWVYQRHGNMIQGRSGAQKFVKLVWKAIFHYCRGTVGYEYLWTTRVTMPIPPPEEFWSPDTTRCTKEDYHQHFRALRAFSNRLTSIDYHSGLWAFAWLWQTQLPSVTDQIVVDGLCHYLPPRQRISCDDRTTDNPPLPIYDDSRFQDSSPRVVQEPLSSLDNALEDDTKVDPKMIEISTSDRDPAAPEPVVHMEVEEVYSEDENEDHKALAKRGSSVMSIDDVGNPHDPTHPEVKANTDIEEEENLYWR